MNMCNNRTHILRGRIAYTQAVYPSFRSRSLFSIPHIASLLPQSCTIHISSDDKNESY